MVERYKDPSMQEVIRRTLRSAMAAENVSYDELVDRLQQAGVVQTASTLRTKVSTGLMTTSLFLHILNVLNVESLSVPELMKRYIQVKDANRCS